ncbi:MAG: hypothetical protein LBD61_05295 [Endomicrobium sp.]|jgi:hypothetical protein|nr:hypothetical protein [Endomicrobium sp.]
MIKALNKRVLVRTMMVILISSFIMPCFVGISLADSLDIEKKKQEQLAKIEIEGAKIRVKEAAVEQKKKEKLAEIELKNKRK